tara:strand:+ start:298 stop:858 length:561 start_codon:yes stop_codon:yes gene_type:complete
MITYGDVTEINYNTRLKLLIIIVFIGLCIIAIWNIKVDFSDFWTSSYVKISIEPKSWLMPVSLILVAYAFIPTIPTLLDNRVQVRISRKGFYWRRWSEETIPWSEVVEINAGTSSKYHAPYVRLQIRNSNKYKNKGIPSFLRFIRAIELPIRFNSSDEILIETSLLEGSNKEILAAFQSAYEKYGT